MRRCFLWNTLFFQTSVLSWVVEGNRNILSPYGHEAGVSAQETMATLSTTQKTPMM